MIVNSPSVSMPLNRTFARWQGFWHLRKAFCSLCGDAFLLTEGCRNLLFAYEVGLCFVLRKLHFYHFFDTLYLRTSEGNSLRHCMVGDMVRFCFNDRISCFVTSNSSCVTLQCFPIHLSYASSEEVSPTCTLLYIHLLYTGFICCILQM